MQILTLPREDQEAQEIALEAELRAAEMRGRELLDAAERAKRVTVLGGYEI